MPKELFKDKQSVKRERSQSQNDASERLLKEGDSSQSKIHPSMKGFQTEEQLRMK